MDLSVGSVVELVQQIASALGASCLTPYESHNPYIMWLVSPSSAPKQIALDEVALDKDRYVIRPISQREVPHEP